MDFEKWQHLANLEDGFLKQRSKLHWLNVGDHNNSYFQKYIQTRKMTNSIKEIKSSSGEILTSNKDLKIEATDISKELLTRQPCDFKGMEVAELQELLVFRCSDSDKSNLI